MTNEGVVALKEGKSVSAFSKCIAQIDAYILAKLNIGLARGKIGAPNCGILCEI